MHYIHDHRHINSKCVTSIFHSSDSSAPSAKTFWAVHTFSLSFYETNDVVQHGAIDNLAAMR